MLHRTRGLFCHQCYILNSVDMIFFLFIAICEAVWLSLRAGLGYGQVSWSLFLAFCCRSFLGWG